MAQDKSTRSTATLLSLRASILNGATSVTKRWRDRALCRETRTSVFLLNENELTADQVTELRRICGACPVRDSCLLDDEAVRGAARHCTRGGFTNRERERINRARRDQARRKKKEMAA
jgi:hypothetical protein